MKRAVYYVSRLISAQKEKEFHDNLQNYDLMKVIVLNLGILLDEYKIELTEKQAMDALQVSPDKQKEYMALI